MERVKNSINITLLPAAWEHKDLRLGSQAYPSECHFSGFCVPFLQSLCHCSEHIFGTKRFIGRQGEGWATQSTPWLMAALLAAPRPKYTLLPLDQKNQHLFLMQSQFCPLCQHQPLLHVGRESVFR